MLTRDSQGIVTIEWEKDLPKIEEIVIEGKIENMDIWIKYFSSDLKNVPLYSVERFKEIFGL